MKKRVNKYIFWMPRILSIAFILFLALFSLDIFGNGLNFWQTVIALFMHNIPSLILLITLLISWKYELFGGIIFSLAGIFYICLTIFNNSLNWYIALSWALTIALPALLIGILFVVGWFKKKKNN